MVANEDFMMANDAHTKKHTANFTVSTAAMIWKPENITIINDVAVTRYLAGWNSRAYTPEELRSLRVDEDWRLAGEAGRASIIFVATPLSDSEHAPEIDPPRLLRARP